MGVKKVALYTGGSGSVNFCLTNIYLKAGA